MGLDGGWVIRGLAAGAVALALMGRTASAQDGAAADPTDEAIQFLADLTVIDGTCRDVAVDFGIGFQFALGQGLAVVSVLPAGARRREFEHDLDATRSGFDQDVICGELARHYATVVPGSVTLPSTGRGHS